MAKFKPVSLVTMVVAMVLACIGVVVCGIQLMDSVAGGIDPLPFACAVLYLLSFIFLFLYGIGKTESSTTFRVMIFSYLAVVLMTGFICPAPAPHGYQVILMILAAVVVAGLILFNLCWKKKALASAILTTVLVCEIATSVIVLTHNPMIMGGEKAVVAACGYCLRPIICISMAVAYLTRMHQKSKEQGIR